MHPSAREAVNFTVTLARVPISIEWEEDANRLAHVYREIFEPFLSTDAGAKGTIRVSRIPSSFDVPAFLSTVDADGQEETPVPQETVRRWADRENNGEFSRLLAKNNLSCVLYKDGLLLYDGINRKAQIYLLNEGDNADDCLYRLFWIGFAQVLGEAGGCFVHAAALVRNGAGYLFFGTSGTGKSTMAHHAGDCAVFSDDAPIVMAKNGGFHVFPSPYQQLVQQKKMEGHLGGISAHIENLSVIIQGDHMERLPLHPHKAMELVMKQFIIFYPLLTSEGRAKLFDLWFVACQNIPTYKVLYEKNANVFEIMTSA